MRLPVLALLLATSTLPLRGAEWKAKGEVALESRAFEDDRVASTQDENLAFFGRLEASYRHGPWRTVVRAFGRVDALDTERSLVVIEEAWAGLRRGPWEVRAGARMLDFTATEAFHPADTVNSRNLDSDLERPEKLGELMISLRRRLGSGSVELFWMPRYTEPIFPSRTSRLSFTPPEIEIGDAVWIETDGGVAPDSWGSQWGLRLTRNLGPADVGLHVLQHQDRQQPVLRPDTAGRIRPIYLPVLEMGGTYLHVIGAWVFKVEVNHKDFENPRGPVELDDGILVEVAREQHSQLALGLEWGWTFSGGADATLLLEGQSVLGVDAPQRAELAIFQRDVLLGYRHRWNDVQGRELLATAIFDLERSHELLFNLSYRQRLSDTWGLKAGLRWIDAPVKGGSPRGLELLDGSNQLFLTITRYF